MGTTCSNSGQCCSKASKKEEASPRGDDVIQQVDDDLMRPQGATSDKVSYPLVTGVDDGLSGPQGATLDKVNNLFHPLPPKQKGLTLDTASPKGLAEQDSSPMYTTVFMGEPSDENYPTHGGNGVTSSVQETEVAEATSPTAGNNSSVGSAAAAELQAKLTKVQQLVDQMLLHEAGIALQALDRDAAQHGACAGSADDTELKDLLVRLQSDPKLVSLRGFARRCEKALQDIAVPAQRTDVTWSEFEIQDPSISPDFSVNFKIRYKTKEEYDSSGPLAQFSAKCVVCNFPLSLSRRVALEREVDLSEVAPSVTVDLLEGQVGGSNQLFSSFVRQVSSTKVSPWKTDAAELREFSRFRAAPIPGLRDNMFGMIASSPPESDTEFAGFHVAPCLDGCKRISGLSIMRFLEAESTSDKCRLTIMAQGGINVPTWLLPLALVKRIFASVLANSFKFVADSIAPRWDKLLYQERMDQCPEFYEAVRLHDVGSPK